MILYDPQQRFNLAEYGIQIPIRDSRMTRTFRHLRSHRLLGPRTDAWWRRPRDEPITASDLQRAHAADYVQRLFGDGLTAEILSTFELVDEQGQYFRYAPEEAQKPLTALFDQLITVVAQSVQCARLALAEGFCFAFSGGMHHAHFDHGSGFCLINDIVAAARKLQADDGVGTVWVIDVDAHKGDGTAALARDDRRLVTLSIHMADGWPLDGPRQMADGRPNPAFASSDIDIPMRAGEDHLYVERLARGLDALDTFPRPDLALVVCGADPFELDELPSTRTLQLSADQMAERDQLVYTFLETRSIPAAYLMAGGYGDATWQVYSRFLEWALLRRLRISSS